MLESRVKSGLEPGLKSSPDMSLFIQSWTLMDFRVYALIAIAWDSKLGLNYNTRCVTCI